MSSSKKHKKHKDRKHSSSNAHDESNHSFNSISNNSVIAGEQGTLKLVLRVPGGSSNSPHMSPSVSIANQDQNAEAMQVEGGSGGLTMHIDTRQYSSSSGKKMKKKKSKKKHKKHHHHSHHHHSHHHRHRSSCSHHKSSSSSALPAIEGSLPTLQLKPPAPPASSYPAIGSGEFNADQPASASNLIDPQTQQQSLISSQLSPQSISQPMSQQSPLAQSQIAQQPQITQQPQIAQQQQITQQSQIVQQQAQIQSPMDQCMSQQQQLPTTGLPSLPPTMSTLDAQGNITPITSPSNCAGQMTPGDQQIACNYVDPYGQNLMAPVSGYNNMTSPMAGMTNYGSSCSMTSPLASPMTSPMGGQMGGQMNSMANNLMNPMAGTSSTGYAPQPMSMDMQIDNGLNQQSQIPPPILSSCQQPVVMEQGIAQSISPISQSPLGQQTMTSPIGQQPLTPQSLAQSMPIGQPTHSQALIKQEQPVQQSQAPPAGQQQLARAPIGVKPPVKTQFQSLLGYLLKQLEKRDPQEFFFWPVTDLIAPGYSKIITKPMDFSKIRQKINMNSYENLIQFRADVKLMCDNAMTYNRSETIYYKAAKKLWYHAREKIFNRESVLDLVTMYQGVTNYELGLTCADYSDSEQINVDNFDYSQLSEQMTPEQAQFLREQGKARREDEMTADEILEEVRRTAREAADRLTLQRPNGAHYTLMRQLDDGTTSLAILGSSVNGYQEEKYVNLESIVGKLSEGAPHLPGFKESDLNTVKSIDPLPVSPFSSYLPYTDSSKSNLNEKETALLLSSYGDEVGLGYSESLLKFASDSDYVLNMVDSLLDALTNGQHSKTMEELKENQKALEAADAKADVEMQEADAKSKEDDSQDKKDPDTLDQKLNETGSLVANLETLQTQRLSSSTLPVKPSKEEVKIAHLLTNKLTELIGTYAKPADVSDLKSIRAALGVQLKEGTV